MDGVTGTASTDDRPDLVVRWTIGDVASGGFEALRLSICGALRLFGRAARYVVCVNTLPVVEAQLRTGPLPAGVVWRAVDRELLPAVLRPFVDEAMSEGTAWKLAPPQIDRGCRELALDNDVILWALPDALARWLDGAGDHTLVAADVVAAHGRFAAVCGPEPRNSSIRGTPAGFDLAAAIADVLRANPVALVSELDEQGLQIAALGRLGRPLVVSTDDVSICSPFPPHQPEPGRCGAHFVGLNARRLPWRFDGRPALDVRREHWHRHRWALYGRVGLVSPSAASHPTGALVGG